jgi:hypothetical protein
MTTARHSCSEKSMRGFEPLELQTGCGDFIDVSRLLAYPSRRVLPDTLGSEPAA